MQTMKGKYEMEKERQIPQEEIERQNTTNKKLVMRNTEEKEKCRLDEEHISLASKNRELCNQVKSLECKLTKVMDKNKMLLSLNEDEKKSKKELEGKLQDVTEKYVVVKDAYKLVKENQDLRAKAKDAENVIEELTTEISKRDDKNMKPSDEIQKKSSVTVAQQNETRRPFGMNGNTYKNR